MLFNSGDRVDVRKSKCGYTGPGEIVDHAFGNTWLVKVSKDGFLPLIMVRLGEMVHCDVQPEKPKKK